MLSSKSAHGITLAAALLDSNQKNTYEKRLTNFFSNIFIFQPLSTLSQRCKRCKNVVPTL